jgi:hypothetical protein
MLLEAQHSPAQHRIKREGAGSTELVENPVSAPK